VFVFGAPSQPSFSTKVKVHWASGLAFKYQTRLRRLARKIHKVSYDHSFIVQATLITIIQSLQT
jgi:hypothetical protein